MSKSMLTGTLVRLAALEPKALAEAINRWDRDSEFRRLLDADPANQYSLKKLTDLCQKEQVDEPRAGYTFGVHTLQGDQLVGFTGLEGHLIPHGEAFVGIGIGDRDIWGKGYGTDAMKVILRFAFQELNLRRVALDTFEYNPRAICSYEKAGFVYEGRVRQFLNREGQRWDMIFMGIMREEWLLADTE
jgi:RimJ/RimL family protein N-acetyltransferase